MPPLRCLPLLLLLLACGAPPEAPPEPAVEPHLNERFLSDDLDVSSYVERFEGESREIAVAREAIADQLELQPGMSVADVGAGTGLFLQTLAGRVGARGTVWAVDIAPRFVEHMTDRAREQGLSQVRAVLCTERSVELPRASIDVAFVCDTYHHFAWPEDSLASLREALRPGGMLVIVDFEREPDTSREWVLDHVRAGADQVIREIERAGFVFRDRPAVEGLSENYLLRFRRP